MEQKKYLQNILAASIWWDLFKSVLRTAIISKKKCIHWVKDGNYISSTTQKSIKHHNFSVAAVVNG